MISQKAVRSYEARQPSLYYRNHPNHNKALQKTRKFNRLHDYQTKSQPLLRLSFHSTSVPRAYRILDLARAPEFNYLLLCILLDSFGTLVAGDLLRRVDLSLLPGRVPIIGGSTRRMQGRGS